MKKIAIHHTAPEFGFGSNTNSARQRLINKDGTANVIRLGEPRFQVINTYHNLIEMPWWKFNLLLLAVYIIANLLFTLLYYLLGAENINGMIYENNFEKFTEVFFFSAQSLTTVGYGRLNPVGVIQGSIATLEAMLGLLSFAVATGLLYGRFSRPNAKLIFSNHAVIAPYRHEKFGDREISALLIRLANARNKSLIEVEGQVLISYNQGEEGNVKRKYQVLDLEIHKITYLALSWTLAHPITENSFFHGLSREDLIAMDVELLVNIKGVDESYAQQVYARTSYKAEEIIPRARFVRAIVELPDGNTAIDLKKISSYELLDS